MYKIFYEYLVEKLPSNKMLISKLNEFNEYKNLKNKNSDDIYNEIIGLLEKKKEKFIKAHAELNNKNKKEYLNELRYLNRGKLQSLNLSSENVQSFFRKYKLKNNGTNNTIEEKQKFLEKIRSILNTKNRQKENTNILDKSIHTAKLGLEKIKKEIINKLEANSIINTRKILNTRLLSNDRKTFAQVKEGNLLNIRMKFPNNNNNNNE